MLASERVGRVRVMGHGVRAVALPSSVDVPQAVLLLLLALALLLLPPPLTLSVVNSRTVSSHMPAAFSAAVTLPTASSSAATIPPYTRRLGVVICGFRATYSGGACRMSPLGASQSGSHDAPPWHASNGRYMNVGGGGAPGPRAAAAAAARWMRLTARAANRFVEYVPDWLRMGAHGWPGPSTTPRSTAVKSPQEKHGDVWLK